MAIANYVSSVIWFISKDTRYIRVDFVLTYRVLMNSDNYK